MASWYKDKELDTLISFALNEMAIKKMKDIKLKVSNFEDIINLHLLKVLTYKDDSNYNKHLKDIDTWLKKVQSYSYQKSDNKLSKDKYFDLLFQEPITDKNNTNWVTDTIERRLSDYKDLPRTNLSDKDILLIMYKIHLGISKLLSENKLDNFKTDIWDKLTIKL